MAVWIAILGGTQDLNLWSGLVLGIESSCDETSASVLVGTEVRSLVIASQIEMHERWGGVVPEAAARAHVEAIIPTISEACDRAHIRIEQITAVGVTNRPGLIGALSVGLTAAKALAWRLHVPLIGVHHLEGHILSPFLNATGIEALAFPHLCLVVSGGHTEMVWVDSPGHYELIGETLDDAAGEAFDKSARLLGLGTPGGKAIQDAAVHGDPLRYKLPRGVARDRYHFSFSGLKTAVRRQVELAGPTLSVPDMAASLQLAIVESLAQKAMGIIEERQARALTLVGGVAANLALRSRLEVDCRRMGVQFCPAQIEFCTDNAAMIALAGSVRLALGERDDESLDAFASASLPVL